jgi:hypothetical protein
MHLMDESGQNPADAATTDASVRVVTDGSGVSPAERRHSNRMPYSSSGTVAAYSPPDVPPQEAFWMIRCRDLSPRGIAFYSPIKPPSSSLLVRLGSVGGADCLLSCRVAHCSDVGTLTSPKFLVGCEFVERVSDRPA